MMREHTMNASSTTFATETTSTMPKWLSTSMIIGGATWITYYGTWIVSGLTTGENPVIGTTFGTFTSILFFAALIGIHSGLVGLGLYLRKRAVGFGTAGLAFALFGVAVSVYGLIASGVFGLRPGTPGGFGVLASCLGATLLAIAALRSKALSRPTGMLLLAIGVVTFPLIIAITAILPTLPSWIVDELPFAMSGAAWIAFGALLKRQ